MYSNLASAECDIGFYGIGCNLTCSEKCPNGTCNPKTGTCACPESQSWNGQNCQETEGVPFIHVQAFVSNEPHYFFVVLTGGSREEQLKTSDSSGIDISIWGGVGGGSAVILVILTIILVIAIRHRKRPETGR